MSKIKVRISETKYCSFYKTLETADENNLIYFAWYGSDINIKAAAKYCTHDHRIL